MEFSRVLKEAWEVRTNLHNPKESIWTLCPAQVSFGVGFLLSPRTQSQTSSSTTLGLFLCSVLFRVPPSCTESQEGKGAEEPGDSLSQKSREWLRASGPRTLHLIIKYL